MVYSVVATKSFWQTTPAKKIYTLPIILGFIVPPSIQVQLFSNMIMEVLISAHASSLPVRKYTTICTCTTSKNNIVYRIAASTIPVSAYTSGFYPLSTLYDGSLIAAYMYRPSGNLLKFWINEVWVWYHGPFWESKPKFNFH